MGGEYALGFNSPNNGIHLVRVVYLGLSALQSKLFSSSSPTRPQISKAGLGIHQWIESMQRETYVLPVQPIHCD